MRRTGPEGATVYYYDGIHPVWEADGAGALKVQLDRDIFGNILSRREASGIRRYFTHDGLGGLTGTTDEAGNHIASLFYDAWGDTRATAGTWAAGNYRFTGAELDPASGLYHMGARFYDSSIGRWLSEDPVQNDSFDPSSLNFYAYVQDNPLTRLDPDGKVALVVVTGLVGAGIGLGAYALTHQRDMTLKGALLALGAGALAGVAIGSGYSLIAGGAGAASAARAAAVIASSAAARVQSSQQKLAHIFDQARHGFQAFGIGRERGLLLIEKTIAEGIADKLSKGTLNVGVHEFHMAMGEAVRVTARGNWDGMAFKVGTAFLEVLVNGHWVMYAP